METFSALLVICAVNSPVPGEFPAQRLVTRSFDVFFDLRLNKRLSKQSWGWWFETLSRSLWCHRNVLLVGDQLWLSYNNGYRSTWPWPLVYGLLTEYHVVTSWHGSTFRISGPLQGETTPYRWIPSQRRVMKSIVVFVVSLHEVLNAHMA